jgi:hypothetical protein
MDDEDGELCLQTLAFAFRKTLYGFLDILPKLR